MQLASTSKHSLPCKLGVCWKMQQHVPYIWLLCVVLPGLSATVFSKHQGSFPVDFDSNKYYLGIDGLVKKSSIHAEQLPASRRIEQEALGGGGAQTSPPTSDVDIYAPATPMNISSVLADGETLDVWLLMGTCCRL